MISVEAAAAVDLRDVENGLRRLLLAGHDLRPVFNRAKRSFRNDLRQHSKDKAGPDGAWRGLSPATVAKRKARTGKQGRKRRKPPKGSNLRILGRLPGAYKLTISPLAMKAVSRVPWSGAHNDPRGARVGHGAKVPGRMYMWLSGRLIAYVSHATLDHMTGAWTSGHGWYGRAR